MGVLDKFLDAIKLNDDYDDDELLDDSLLEDEDDYDDDFLDEDDDMEEKPKKKFFEKFSKKKNDEEEDFLDDEPEDETVKAPVAKSSARQLQPSSGKTGPYFQTGTFFQDHPDAYKQAFFPGCKYGSLCDQAYNNGGSKRNCRYTGR